MVKNTCLTSPVGVLRFNVGSHLFINTMIIEENETECLSYDETIDLFCAINRDIAFLTQRVEFNKNDPEGSEFWGQRLNRLNSVKSKLQKGFVLNNLAFGRF